jgi:hypothetical protein
MILKYHAAMINIGAKFALLFRAAYDITGYLEPFRLMLHRLDELFELGGIMGGMETAGDLEITG